MLAAESAWRVLRAEHARMRELLASLDGKLLDDDWKRPGRPLSSLRALIRRLQTFDDATHRPKGVVLLATLRGRSSEADALVDELQRERERCDQLLARALSLLDALERGTEEVAEELRSVLRQHGKLMLRHMDCEDTLLHSHTAQLLTAAEWSNVVSSISAVVQSTAVRERRRPS